MPRRLLQEKRKTIGLRVPSNPIALALLDTLGEPMPLDVVDAAWQRLYRVGPGGD
ncbi:YciO family [Salmonella enterica subsp. enterica]|uniref:YciO family n=1 Tax=Salmonella enterica I TaxID=59201 RepID=A0A447PB95_SALET|nr:YciO family [Salmonella enterica subsp. enterica]